MKRITPVVLVDEPDHQVEHVHGAEPASDIRGLVTERFDHSGVSLFVEIDLPFDELTERLGRTGAEVLVPDRRTFYGAREIGVRTPQGLFVVFAEFEEAEAG